MGHQGTFVQYAGALTPGTEKEDDHDHDQAGGGWIGDR